MDMTGIYIIMYTLQILRNIIEKRNAVDVRDIPYKANEMREQLKYACEAKISQRRFKRKEENLIDILQDLMKKKEIMEKEKAEKAKKEKNIHEKKTSKSNRDTVYQKITEDKGKNEERKDRVLDIEECRYYRLGKCKYDNNCRYTHKKDNNKEETERKKEGDKMLHETNVKNMRRREESRKNGGNDSHREYCHDFFQSVCRFGNYCRYKHPEICKSWEEIGRCNGVNGSCEKPHPLICRSYTENEICHRTRCRFVHPRQKKNINVKAQQGAPPRVQDHKLERGRYNINRNQGVQHRKHFLRHQGRGPHARDRSFWERENTGFQWAMIKKIVREEMEDSMRRGWYPKSY